jgi:hypothetical protein
VFIGIWDSLKTFFKGLLYKTIWGTLPVNVHGTFRFTFIKLYIIITLVGSPGVVSMKGKAVCSDRGQAFE